MSDYIYVGALLELVREEGFYPVEVISKELDREGEWVVEFKDARNPPEGIIRRVKSVMLRPIPEDFNKESIETNWKVEVCSKKIWLKGEVTKVDEDEKDASKKYKVSAKYRANNGEILKKEMPCGAATIRPSYSYTQRGNWEPVDQ